MAISERSKIPLKKINHLIDNKCHSCALKKQHKRTDDSHYRHFDTFCNTSCPVGKELQALGKLLVRA